MRILVLGAGAVGGYFGGRLLEKGEDVTFLVREGRQRQIKEGGLVIKSIHGDVTLHPKTVKAGGQAEPFDIIIMTTKAYHLRQAIEDIRPYTGKETVILPLLNGIAHLSVLQEEFGREKVIGGLCFIETTLGEKGEVLQTSPIHEVVFGELSGQITERIVHINKVFQETKASFRLSKHISADMWHKYMFIAVLSGATTLMRAPIGPIRDVEKGYGFIEQLFMEISHIMQQEGAPIDKEIVQKHLKTMDRMNYEMKSSMLRDMEKKTFIEADHLQGHLLSLAKMHKIEAPLLQTVYQNLKIYEKMQGF